VSPDEAAQAIAAIAVDQTAIRTAVAPPSWYILLVSICLGAIYARFAVPDSWTWILISAKILILAGILTAVIYLFARRKSVRAGRLALFGSPRRAIPIIALFVVIVVLTCIEPLPVPWWGHLCIGVCVGTVTYVIARWAWRTWAVTPSR